MTNQILRNKSKEIINIGGIPVFTTQGAIEAYKAFVKRASDFEKYGAEGVYAISAEDEKMLRLGFTPVEIERFEIEAYEEEMI